MVNKERLLCTAASIAFLLMEIELQCPWRCVGLFAKRCTSTSAVRAKLNGNWNFSSDLCRLYVVEQWCVSKLHASRFKQTLALVGAAYYRHPYGVIVLRPGGVEILLSWQVLEASSLQKEACIFTDTSCKYWASWYSNADPLWHFLLPVKAASSVALALKKSKTIFDKPWPVNNNAYAFRL